MTYACLIAGRKKKSVAANIMSRQLLNNSVVGVSFLFIFKSPTAYIFMLRVLIVDSSNTIVFMYIYYSNN